MLGFVIRRLLLSIITLVILITIVFLITAVFPDDPGRSLAGPFASQQVVDSINERIGANDPKLEQYARLVKNTITFDFGDSFQFNKPVSETLFPALGRSSKLVALGLIMTLPLALMGGIIAARRKDTLLDRGIVTLGLASSSIPEFVSGVALQYLLAVKLGWFEAVAAPNRGFFGELKFLVLPALAIVIVYFGYIARIARAGTIQALDSDYTRTAYMKGLSSRDVIRKHVLRNSLQPTVAVVGTQIGYLFGGLVGLEVIFNYQGLGNLIYNAAREQDYPMLQAGVILVAIIFMVCTLIADLIIAWMNPRARLNVRS